MVEIFSMSSSILSTVLLLAAAYITASYFKRVGKKSLPYFVLSKENDGGFFKGLQEAYTKYRNIPYTVPAEPPYLILPRQYLPEVKSIPDSVMNFHEDLFIRFAGKYSSIGLAPSAMIKSIKIDLTRNIKKVLEELQNESSYVIPKVVGPCEDWTEVSAYSSVLQIVAVISGRVFVGYPLCRDEQWVEMAITFTVACFSASAALLKIPSWIRPLVARWAPEVKLINTYRAMGTRLLKPIIEERIAAMKKDPNFVLPNDLIEFLMRNSDEQGKEDVAELAHHELLVSIAAIHTTSMNLTQVIYDLCAHPEFVEGLRDELVSVLADDEGVLVKSSMPKLKKMDSFMKESQRMSPAGAVVMGRIVKEDFRFSDGLEIPKGTSVAFNNIGPLMDPSAYENPEIFDGFRFSKLREQPGDETKHQFVTTGPDSLNFGHGVHACPGRFFASNEVKVALAFILQNYDVKLKDGHQRPLNVQQGTAVIPDPTASVMFRKRK